MRRRPHSSPGDRESIAARLFRPAAPLVIAAGAVAFLAQMIRDLRRSMRIDRRAVWALWTGIPMAIAAAAVIAIVVSHSIVPGPPDQPIDFKHKVMAGDMGIDCYFCHPTPAVSTNAGLPPVDKCLYCHYSIIVTASEEVYGDVKQGRTIPWRRVASVPDYVRFNHECHIAGGHECSDCHGDVAHMEKTHVTKNFTMSFCVDCHRRNRVSVDCFLCHY